MIVAIIPVRLESSRLPQKALKEIEGLPMIIHTMKRTQLASSIDEVFVATDNKILSDLIKEHGGKVIMTNKNHKTGSDRIAEAAEKINAEIIVNVQGDEPLVMPEHIDAGVNSIVKSDTPVSILLTKFSKRESPSDIKAVINKKNEILYFSRADIPSTSRHNHADFLKAYHVVSFKKEFLIKFSRMPRFQLEIAEFNEYLRIIENGHKIQGVIVNSNAVSVDTIDDLKYVKQLMIEDKLKYKYL